MILFIYKLFLIFIYLFIYLAIYLVIYLHITLLTDSNIAMTGILNCGIILIIFIIEF